MESALEQNKACDRTAAVVPTMCLMLHGVHAISLVSTGLDISSQAFLVHLSAIYKSQYQGKQQDWPWYAFAAVTLQIYDEMQLIGQVWEVALKQTPEEENQLRIARQMREALLKASVLVGFPKGINALSTLRNAISESAPELAQKLDKDTSLRKSIRESDKKSRGKAFFSKLYAQHTDRVLENMSKASGGDLAEFAINAVYGDLMAETSRLDGQSTSLLEFIACYGSAGSTALQAKSHMYGSHNMGNTKAEVKSAITICDEIEAALDVKKDRSDWNWLAKIDSW